MTDPHEELTRLIRDHWHSLRGVPTDPMRAASEAADAVLAALPSLGYVKLSDLASDEATIEKVEQALVYHQRKNIESCQCGWSKLGHSHARHQAEHVFAALTATPEDSR